MYLEDYPMESPQSYEDWEEEMLDSTKDDYIDVYNENSNDYTRYNLNYYELGENSRIIEKTNMKEEVKAAKHYIRQGTSSYSFVDDVIEQIPADFYRPVYDSYKMVASMEKRDIVLPKLYRLPDNVFEDIMQDIEHFWGNRERYEKFNNVYKRNILLYSVPGNGKTSLINLLCFDLIHKHNGLVFLINTVADLVAYPKCIERVRQIEPLRPIITIIEDFDGLVNHDKNSETLLLQILDGNNQYSGVVTIATTNHVDQLNPAFTDRPSRFNFVIEYKKPSEEVRRFFFTHKLQDSGYDIENPEIADNIEMMVKESEGFTFDYCKEFLEAIYVQEYSRKAALEKIQTAIKQRGKYKITEKDKKLGFV